MKKIIFCLSFLFVFFLLSHSPAEAAHTQTKTVKNSHYHHIQIHNIKGLKQTHHKASHNSIVPALQPVIEPIMTTHQTTIKSVYYDNGSYFFSTQDNQVIKILQIAQSDPIQKVLSDWLLNKTVNINFTGQTVSSWLISQ